MTDIKLDKTYKASRNSNIIKAIVSISAMLLLFLFLSKSNYISKEIFSVIVETAEIIIPSLFPLMILSRFMCNYGILEFYEKISGKVIATLMNTSPKACGSILISFLSSFPVGTMTVCKLFDNGILTKEEAEESLGLSHHTGPAFPIAVIGMKFYGNIIYGIVIYFIQIVASIISSKLMSIKKPVIQYKTNRNETFVYQSFSESITDAVCSTAEGCVNIIGFVSLGKLIISTLHMLFNINPLTNAVISSLIEFSTGCTLSSNLQGAVGFALCSFSLCFGGIVSLLQAASYSAPRKLSLKKCIRFKLTEAIIAVILSILSYSFIIR